VVHCLNCGRVFTEFIKIEKVKKHEIGFRWSAENVDID
jgi:uncharacterized Zn finger protein